MPPYLSIIVPVNPDDRCMAVSPRRKRIAATATGVMPFRGSDMPSRLLSNRKIFPILMQFVPYRPDTNAKDLRGLCLVSLRILQCLQN